jgi:hypothetical protein
LIERIIRNLGENINDKYQVDLRGEPPQVSFIAARNNNFGSQAERWV